MMALGPGGSIMAGDGGRAVHVHVAVGYFFQGTIFAENEVEALDYAAD